MFERFFKNTLQNARSAILFYQFSQCLNNNITISPYLNYLFTTSDLGLDKIWKSVNLKTQLQQSIH